MYGLTNKPFVCALSASFASLRFLTLPAKSRRKSEAQQPTMLNTATPCPSWQTLHAHPTCWTDDFCTSRASGLLLKSFLGDAICIPLSHAQAGKHCMLHPTCRTDNLYTSRADGLSKTASLMMQSSQNKHTFLADSAHNSSEILSWPPRFLLRRQRTRGQTVSTGCTLTPRLTAARRRAGQRFPGSAHF
jgi:hypothetical protein